MILLRDDISEIVRILEEGGIICYPTDTIWGLGCDATNVGYVLLVSDLPMLKTYVPKIHPRIETLLAYHKRPLTVIYERNIGLPPEAKAPDGSAAIRIPVDEFCQTLVGLFGKPIVSTSANISGQPFPTTFGTISSDVLGAVDYVVKHRQEDKEPGEPSAIARLDRHHELEFIRE
jgi:L-threonylcarbamoyladenylate synthase